jgi:hypothetical protein
LLLFGASGVFAELQDALNTIWEVQAKKKGGLLGVIKARFLSFTVVLGTAFLLLVALVLTAAVSAFGGMLNAWLPFGELLAKVLDFALSFGVVTLLYAMIFKILPDVKLAWSDVWIGAAATAALFTVGKFLIGLYLGRGNVGSDYGPAASVIIMIVCTIPRRFSSWAQSLLRFMRIDTTPVSFRLKAPNRLPLKDGCNKGCRRKHHLQPRMSVNNLPQGRLQGLAC